MIRLKPDELETVAKHIPDAEDACERARTTLSRELSSLAMDLPGVSTPAIEALRDELVHWLRRYEDKLNEAEELLYRTAAAMRQADQTLADNMKEFGLELLGWYDVQRVFGEYDPITGERLSLGDRLLAGGMLLASIFPPAKGAGMARKVAIKGAKAMEAASILSKMKHVVRYDKIKVIFETIYRQVVKAPFAETARLFKKQWDDLVESVSVVGWKPVYVGVGPTSRVWMNEARNEVKDATLHMMKKIEGEAIDSIPKSSNSSIKDTGKNAIKNVKFYSTRIDNQVEEIEKMPLPQTIAATFKDSNYRTVITKENITVYRAFGGHADAGGTFATTSPAVNRIHTKIDLALLPEWKNTRNYEAVIEVPKGTILNIGRAEQQMTKTGSILKGDADQILLPLNYPLEWIKEIRRIPSK
ncbi:pre-toxin TG domain-containing protein [Anoxybacteroides tepidamans]|uniref:pre-toxin TG domain-containing protein n=1 Tax=Anoxybacteroides tepidamans TaxID=265948 RepID=UPI000A87DF2F|nr:pre-toxin TG domain-containing protein [Anoxybacillus tepidamans]